MATVRSSTIHVTGALPEALSEHHAQPVTGTLTFDEIYNEHVDLVWRTIRRLGILEEAVEDRVQDVFVVVHRRLHEFDYRSSVRTWILGIVVRVLSDYRRTLRRRFPYWQRGVETMEPDELPELCAGLASDENSEREFAAHQASRIIDLALSSLREPHRTVFVLMDIEGVTAKEVATVLGETPSAIYSYLRSARTKFQREAAKLRRRFAEEKR